MKQRRKRHTADEKVAILNGHILQRAVDPALCDELGPRPTVFFRWQKEFFENEAAADGVCPAEMSKLRRAAATWLRAGHESSSTRLPLSA